MRLHVCRGRSPIFVKGGGMDKAVLSFSGGLNRDDEPDVVLCRHPDAAVVDAIGANAPDLDGVYCIFFCFKYI